MSSTRHAIPGTPLRQERWASNPQYDFALKANLVSKRCTLLESADEIDLIWFLQFVCMRDGGMVQIAESLCREYSERIGTPSMRSFGCGAKQVYNAEQVRSIRSEMPEKLHSHFLLKDELSVEEKFTSDFGDVCNSDRMKMAVVSANRPTSYPAAAFQKFCLSAAAEMLSDYLIRVCLDPDTSLSAGPWYFADLQAALHEFKNGWLQEHQASTVVREAGKIIYDSIAFAQSTQQLALLTGPIGIGATFAAKAWCEQFPWRARYVQVPSSNDKKSFFRAIADSLGVPNNLKSKSQELQERCESVLQNSRMALVLDEADLLLPNTNLRDSMPDRLQWILAALLAYEVPVVLIGSPNFFTKLQLFDQKGGWSVDQFTDRIAIYNKLPEKLSSEDLIRIGKAMLPGADRRQLLAISFQVKASQQFLACMNKVVRAAKYEAQQAGRGEPTAADIATALSNWLVPTAENLAAATQSTSGKRAKLPTVATAAPSARMVSESGAGASRIDRTEMNLGAAERHSASPSLSQTQRVSPVDLAVE